MVEIQNITRSIHLKFVYSTEQQHPTQVGVGDMDLTKLHIKLIPEVWLAELSISDLELENSDRSSENSDLLSL